MPDWLPRVPLALLACARAALVPGEAGRALAEPLEWPALALPARWRSPEPVRLQAPAS